MRVVLNWPAISYAYEATFLYKAGHHRTFLFLVLSLILSQDSAVSQVVSSASQNLLLLIVFNGLFSMVPPISGRFLKQGYPGYHHRFPVMMRKTRVPHFRKPPKSLLFSVSHSSCCFNHRFHGALLLGGTSSCSLKKWVIGGLLFNVSQLCSISSQLYTKTGIN